MSHTMTRKKKGQKGQKGQDARDSSTTTPSSSTASIVAPTREKTSSPSSVASSKDGGKDPSSSALIICRNKHWRYISSFHGPWLQLPPEVLESLAHSNYFAPRPHPIDPAVFYDLVKIRRLVEEATTLAVRATSGVTSSYLNNSLNANNGLLGGTGAAALGLGLGGGGGNSRLSKERRHRMRELATQKLSRAYHLDEIAASVATMQSASTLEEVAKLVLQRSSNDSDAKYVHFFHEKIPSRMLAKCTSLQPLDDVIVDRPSEAAPLRTRAVTRIFKEDFTGAARDLTEALSVCRLRQVQHRKQDTESIGLGRASPSLARGSRNGDWRSDMKLAEEDQPSSLEEQLLFHRAGICLTIAIQHVDDALPPTVQVTTESIVDGTETLGIEGTALARTATTAIQAAAEQAVEIKRENARKIVKANAKRALRDYIKFLSHFEYTPGLPSEVSEDFLRAVNSAANGITKETDALNNSKLIEMTRNPNSGFPNLPTPDIYTVSSLFSSTPPSNLPTYPSTDLTIIKKPSNPVPENPTTSAAAALLAAQDSHESITYHPLLTDALHSFLLCHCLLQTSSKELLRHAYMVARLARVCDGYPIFLAARSPARADWMEVIRRSGNWVGLNSSWEVLCAPAPLRGHNCPVSPEEQEKRRREDTVAEVLENNNVHDEESFAAALSVIERREKEELRAGDSGLPRRWAQDDGKEYPISTDRAAVITRWMKDGARREQEGVIKRKEEARLKELTKQEAEGAAEGLLH
ncbi:hypothetical protein FGG08_004783 [Glutinoglossum americanum]|uniref:Histidine kinase group protein n=1 Tax=Glutinoglossum americanum TaxID=1670608 RepID=A0A9P8HZT7_9PEZI|nr:hypothetical protein FGG08_004783 [Glutinoglossum americanum]